MGAKRLRNEEEREMNQLAEKKRENVIREILKSVFPSNIYRIILLFSGLFVGEIENLGPFRVLPFDPDPPSWLTLLDLSVSTFCNISDG